MSQMITIDDIPVEIPQSSLQFQAYLHQLPIDADSPGSLIRDVATLLDYLEANPTPASGKYASFPLATLPKLNQLLTTPTPLALKRPQLTSFPHLQGLFLLMRVSDLLQVTRKTRQLSVHPQCASAWRKADMKTRFFFLLEAWVTKGFPYLLGRKIFHLPSEFWPRCFAQENDAKEPVIRSAEEIASLGPYLLGLFHLFGMVELTYGAPKKNGAWQISKLKPTRLGITLSKVINPIFQANYPLMGKILDEVLPCGYLAPLFRLLFDVEPLAFTLEEEQVVELTGTAIFKVVFGDVKLRLSLPLTHSYDHLAELILSALDWDNDHLYCFRYTSRLGFAEEINHPEMEDGPHADEVTIASSEIMPGDKLIFHFDFGDDHRMKISFSAHEPENHSKEGQILEIKGELPQQYPTYDEDD